MPKRPTIYDLNLTVGGALYFTSITFGDGETEPLVDEGNLFITANTSATTITDFLNGHEGQEIEIRVDANTTIRNNQNIRLENGQDFTGTGTSFVDQSNAVIKLRLYSGVWLQIAPVCFSGEAPPGGGQTLDSPLTTTSPISSSPGFGSPTTVISSPTQTVVAIGVGWAGGAVVETYDPPYTTWLGRYPDCYSDYIIPYGTIGINGSWTFITNPNYTSGAIDNFGNWLLTRTNRRMELVIGPMPWVGSAGSNKGYYWGEIAAGTHDAKFTAMANSLKDDYHLGGSAEQPVYIRLAWEMDLNFSHGVGTDATKMANFAPGWRRIVDRMRDVSPYFRFAFCPNIYTYRLSQWGPSWINAIYPGNDYVDLIGGDFYDASGAYYPISSLENQTACWNNNHVLNLQAMDDFAQSNGKPQMFGEWGVWHRVSGTDDGGNDNPLFIENTYNWVTDPNHNFEFVNYFNANGAYQHRLDTSQFPNASLKYRQTFGAAPHPNW